MIKIEPEPKKTHAGIPVSKKSVQRSLKINLVILIIFLSEVPE